MIKKPLLIASTALFSMTAAHAGGDGWTHDFEAAKEQAAKEGKSLLIDFTGTDWCKWCIKLDQEVFQHEPFKAGVVDKFVLVELDYPKTAEGLAKLSEETKKQNEELKKKYQPPGYPTILITDAEGRPYAKTGYRPGGPEAYVTHLNDLLAKKEERDAIFAKAEDETGLAKAQTLFEGLSIVPADYRRLYPEIVAEVRENDPEDTTGLGAAIDQQEALFNVEEAIKEAMRGKDNEKAISLIDDFLGKHELAGPKKKKLLATKFTIHIRAKNYDEVEKIADELIALEPDSRYSQQVAAFKNGKLQELKKKAAEDGEEKKTDEVEEGEKPEADQKAKEDRKPEAGQKAAGSE